MSSGWPDSPTRHPRPGAQAGLTRRQFLAGGGVVVASVAVAGTVGWRSWRVRDAWYRFSGAYGEPGTPPPAYDVTYVDGELPSVSLVASAAFTVAYPPGIRPDDTAAVRRLPVLICLPGRGRAPGEVLQRGLRFGDYVADAIEKRGAKPFAVAAVQASDTYWHARDSGDDAMAMLSDEFVPFIRRDLGLRGPLAVMGWSMGGYGALRAAELHPQRFRGVCAASPALWQSFDAGVGDAFDSAADYTADDVYAEAARLRGMPVRVDCGRQDPFYEAALAFAEALPEPPAGGFEPGGHNDAYWRRVAPAQVDFINRVFGGASPEA